MALNYFLYPLTLKFNILHILAFVIILFNFFAIGYITATLNISPRTAQAIGILVFFICLFFSGLVIPFDESNIILNKVSTISPFRVSINVLTAVTDIEHIFNYSKYLIIILVYTIINLLIIVLKGRFSKEIIQK
ncbi:ABC transporter permease [Mammaliicoccus sciuri]|uniref:ABC transporter permease n=1 Tax=Mammaliicoccus sciuri TaxID=1296 RepID=UPI00374E0B55